MLLNCDTIPRYVNSSEAYHVHVVMWLLYNGVVKDGFISTTKNQK